MWLMTRLAIVFYVTIIWVASILVMLFVFHALDYNSVTQVLSLIYNDRHVGVIVASIACGIIFMSLMLENLIYGRRRRERNIAFENPAGAVTVSLSALEDLIRRLNAQIYEIKEIRPTVLAIRKGLDIDIKLVLRQETNIPELTARLQDLVRRKIEEAIGMEGKLNIHVHVIKILLDDARVKRPVALKDPYVPFHGYRA